MDFFVIGPPFMHYAAFITPSERQGPMARLVVGENGDTILARRFMKMAWERGFQSADETLPIQLLCSQQPIGLGLRKFSNYSVKGLLS
jgi:hypothetical protein